jgi:hypothetical protein
MQRVSQSSLGFFKILKAFKQGRHYLFIFDRTLVDGW